jgi:diaminopimelate epimerase
MLVNFEKMQGLGNDFVIIDTITQNLRLDSAQIQRIANRHFGIGCDQVILLEPPIRPDADFFYRIYNADGQEVEQCGNGARCAARFYYDLGFASHKTLHADCLAGPIVMQIEEDDSVSIGMGKPIFSPEHIPFAQDQESDLYSLPLEINSIKLAALPLCEKTQREFKEQDKQSKSDEKTIRFAVLSMGNPHAVLQVTDIEKIPVAELGSFFSAHPLFPKGTNVGFMQILDPHHIRIRVYERGVGETLACGTGASAAAVAGIKLKHLQTPVTVSFSTGDLQISWEGEGSSVMMRGPALSVFAGRFRL